MAGLPFPHARSKPTGAPSAGWTGEWLGPGRMAPGERREIASGNGEVIKIAVVEAVQLVECPLIADPLVRPEHERAEKARIGIAPLAQEGGNVGNGETLLHGSAERTP